MSKDTYYILLLLIVFLGTIWDWILNYMNTKARKTILPDNLKGIIEEDTYGKSQAYMKEKERVDLIKNLISFCIIVPTLVLGWLGTLDHFVQEQTESIYLQTLLFIGIIGLISMFLSLPFSYYTQFWIEGKYGFNKSTRRLFWLDQLKALLLSIILGGVLISLLLYFYEHALQYFWIIGWGTMIIISLLANFFYSSLIVPLFNKQTPLPENSLRNKIEQLAQKAQFKLKNIFIIDGSKRTSKANAYFAGLGAKKRIVLYDTLTEKLSEDETAAVLAHEIGHYKKKHVLINLLIATIQLGFTFYILSLFLGEHALGQALGAENTNFYIGIVGFSILYSPISIITEIIINTISRKNEYEADDYAIQISDRSHFTEALKKLHVDALSNLTPHPAYVFVHYSHPPLLKRIENINSK
ncbi:MAG: M48 family metallopeptidase [Hyphomicrobiales bacterium]